uniref:CTCHY-type domain-containing protein n=1 Tax=Angiostrongylus cantonensis TaxID=6313 RepID=A0A0K0D5J2_ANGCA
MLVDHFYDESSSEELHSFFSCSSVLLVCDPPFGVFLNPLMRTVDALKQRHQNFRFVDGNPATFYGCIVIPMFVGKHVLRSYKDYWMSDYRITYENHKLFSNASKTIVRCFTNLKTDVFDLSNVEGYKFCEFCEKYVSSTNKHCFMCSSCTSKVYSLLIVFFCSYLKTRCEENFIARIYHTAMKHHLYHL